MFPYRIFYYYFFFTLQYCIGFSIHQHEPATGVHVFPILKPLPPPSPYHPSGSSQCTSPEHPVSCIEPGLAIHFTYIIHVSMPFSQIIPPSPSPTVSKRLFYRSVFLLLSRMLLLLQSCLTLCDPIDSSPPGCPIPGILQARTLELGCHFLL